MAEEYLVKEGDCMSNIADKYGFFVNTLWNHASNAELKAKRKRPDVLAAGDVVAIPDKKVKEETVAVGERHRFLKKGIPAKVKLRVLYRSEPHARVPWVVVVEGKTQEGETDGDGILEFAIPPKAKVADVRVGPPDREKRFKLQLGVIDPIEEFSGIRSRLENLGFPCGSAEDGEDDAAKEAIRLFQKSFSHPEPSGELDERTRQELQSLHDGD
jgi:hypothetical protein